MKRAAYILLSLLLTAHLHVPVLFGGAVRSVPVPEVLAVVVFTAITVLVLAIARAGWGFRLGDLAARWWGLTA